MPTETHADRTPSTPPVEVPTERELRFVAQTLVESEARYRSIVASMSEGVVLQDAQGRIIECNASAERILGLSREQMMGLTSLNPRWKATDAAGRPTRGEDHPIRVTLRTGAPQRDVVMGVPRADGTRAWVCVNTQPLFRPGEAQPFAVVATFADITDMQRAEAELRESAVTLEVSDHGAGFDQTGAYPGHLGLRTMRERAGMIGAELEIESAAGVGTIVRVRMPMRSPAYST